MQVCNDKYRAEGIEEMKKIFKDFDRNGNGLIEPLEFKYCMRVWGTEFTEEEVS